MSTNRRANSGTWHLQKARASIAVVATLVLIGSAAPAYAEDAAVPADTSITTPPPTTVSTDPPATEPATTPPAAETPSEPVVGDVAPPAEPASAPQTTTTSGTTSGTTSTTTKQVARVVNPADAAVLALVGPAISFGDFEIDGNLAETAAEPGTHDWSTDGVSGNDGFGDSTGFTQGDKEEDNPAGWHTGGSAPAKDDIGIGRTWAHVYNGDVYAYFAYNRLSNNGTAHFDIEFNQKANTSSNPARPDRSNGDLLFTFEQNGSSTLSVEGSWVYKSVGACPPGTPVGSFAVSGAGTWCAVSLTNIGANFKSAVSADDLFAEAGLNLTQLLIGSSVTCTGTFGTLNLRSRSSNAPTAALQDFIFPLTARVPSTCGRVVIEKRDKNSNALIGGASFTISPNPIPGGVGNLNVVDGGLNDSDATANGVITINPSEPGQYTVTETAAPTGYWLAFPRSQTLTLADGGGAVQTFTFNDERTWAAPTVTKTAEGKYDATYNWSINKSVAASANGPWQDVELQQTASSNLSFFYQITVTQGVRDTSNYRVTGTITVNNPNALAMTVNLADALSTGGSCVVNGGTTSVSVASGAHGYGYTCTPANHSNGTNTATISWDKDAYPVSQNEADGIFGGNQTASAASPATAFNFDGAPTAETNKTVTITDNQHVFDPVWTITWTAQGATESKTYSVIPTVPAGTCSPWVDNIAFVKVGTTTLDQNGARRKMCVAADLTVTKNATTALTRTFLWKIAKDTTTPNLTTDANGNAVANYSVKVSRGDGDGYLDSGWQMSGDITVTNPNDFEDITLSTITDVYDGGGTCTVTAPDKVILKGTSKVFHYTCLFSSKPKYDGINTATITWNAATAETLTGTDSGTADVTESQWDLTKVQEDVTVTDDHYTGGTGVGGHTLGTVTWNAAPKTFTYSLTWTGTPGACEVHPNTATIVETQQSDSANVTVCSPLGVRIVKGVPNASYDTTYKWGLDKLVRVDGGAYGESASKTIDAYSYPFDYRVVATPLAVNHAVDDSGWDMTGTITVANPNQSALIPAIDVTIADVPNVGAAATCGYERFGASGIPSDTVSLASGASATFVYTCTFDDKPDYHGGTNVATATVDSVVTESAPRDVDFNLDDEFDKTLPVFDDNLDQDPAAQIGEATWSDALTPEVIDYTKVVNAIKGQACTTRTNTAWIGETATQQSSVKDSADATICPIAGTWTVAKSSNVGDGPVPVDSDITYTLTATKTGGVDPENVVVNDNLSAIFPALVDFDLSSVTGLASGDTAELNGTTLKWTIGTLSGIKTLSFTVHVKATSYGVDLPNLVTSPGSSNCPNADAAVAACSVDNDTPHYTLAKASSVDEGGSVLPPYQGSPGSLITYTLTVHNDSGAVINSTTMPGAQVTDDLSDVLDNAEFVDGSIDPDQAELVGTTLTWTLPTIAIGADATLTYQVRVTGSADDASEWNQTLHNIALPGDGGNCVPATEGDAKPCETTSVTPPVTTMVVKKVNFETSEALEGAEFTLYVDNAPFANAGSPEVGEEDTQLQVDVSDADGLAKFAELLRGRFLVAETAPPEGYSLPLDGTDTILVIIDDSNFATNDEMSPFEFRDPALGQIALLAKRQYEIDPATGEWDTEESDGVTEYGGLVKYVIGVSATGPKVFHHVMLSDYIPGYNPDDVTSTGKATLVEGSPKCTGTLTCTITVGDDGLVTWDVGTVTNASGEIEMVVKFPDLDPDGIPDADGAINATLWNVGYLDYEELVIPTTPQLPDAAPVYVGHNLTSNEVIIAASETPLVEPPIVEPPIVEPPVVIVEPPTVLPSTGGPRVIYLPLSILLMLLGGWLIRSRKEEQLN